MNNSRNILRTTILIKSFSIICVLVITSLYLFVYTNSNQSEQAKLTSLLSSDGIHFSQKSNYSNFINDVEQNIRPELGKGLSVETQRASTLNDNQISPNASQQSNHYFTINVSQTANYSNMQEILDRCSGPVYINMNTGRPSNLISNPGLPPLIAEHEHCGGDSRINARNIGETIVLSGTGPSGTFQVISRTIVPKISQENVLYNRGDVVLQTCVGHEMILVGLKRIE